MPTAIKRNFLSRKQARALEDRVAKDSASVLAHKSAELAAKSLSAELGFPITSANVDSALETMGVEANYTNNRPKGGLSPIISKIESLTQLTSHLQARLAYLEERLGVSPLEHRTTPPAVLSGMAGTPHRA